MEIELQSISPISFSMIKLGDTVRIEHKPAKLNEYREKIGPAVDCYLIFKGQTKIGMIPNNFVKNHKDYLKKRVCKISGIDKDQSKISIFLTASEPKSEEPKGL
ncbi:MAG: hypothetical protein WBH99_01455 [Azovibrio sp.]|uniref:hypothetical protein n=1 Tax=Azovibrio sp. TaxID=1872673 RepID=UPI003C75473B